MYSLQLMITMWQRLRLLLTPINSSQMCPFSMYFARFCDNEHVIFKSALVILKDLMSLNLTKRKIISMQLIIENPVRRPMVHPIRLSWASSLIFLSLAISSMVVVSKRSPEEQILHDKDLGNTFCINLQFELGCENCFLR